MKLDVHVSIAGLNAERVHNRFTYAILEEGDRVSIFLSKL